MHILDPRGSSRLDVLAHHGNHQVEQTDGFDESETQNGVGEELTTQSRVAGDTEEEGTEDETDTDTGTTETDGGRAHTHVLGDLDHGVGDFRGVLAAGLDVGEDLASVGLDEAGLLTLDGLEGGHGESGLALGGEGPLRSQLETSGRTSNLGGCGHLGGQARGKDTRGGHCDFCGGVFFFFEIGDGLKEGRLECVEGKERKKRRGRKKESWESFWGVRKKAGGQDDPETHQGHKYFHAEFSPVGV